MLCASNWNSFWLSAGGGRWCDTVTQKYLVTFLKLFVPKIMSVHSANQDSPITLFINFIKNDL